MPEPDIFRVAAEFRQALLRQERAAATEMVRAYGDAWNRIKASLDQLNADISEVRDAGLDVPTSWLFQQGRLQSIEHQLQAELRRLAGMADGTITAQQRQAVEAAQAHAEQLAMTGLGSPPAGVTIRWDRLPREALTDLVGFLQSGSPLRDLLDGLGAEVSAGFRKALITGVATGQNPRAIARQVRREFGLGLARTLTICRTETIRAYRESSRRSYEANSDVVKGWIWHSALGKRTCPACWTLHGSKHELSERLDDHPNGRCSAIPLTVTWADILGKEKAKGISDTRAQVERGTDIFQRLSEPEQRQILGPAAFAAYKAGAVKLSDFVGRKQSKRWGTMRYARSLQEILGTEQSAKYLDPVRREAALKAAETRRATELRQEQEVISKVERSIRSLKREHLRVLGSDGKVLIERDGDLDRIRIDDLDLSVFRGNTVIHNHPNDTSFSRADVRTLLTHKAKQIRVTAKEWTYSLDLPDDTEWEDVEDLVEIIRDEVSQTHKEAIRRGILTLDESDSAYWHNVWEAVAEVRGWQYRRNPIE